MIGVKAQLAVCAGLSAAAAAAGNHIGAALSGVGVEALMSSNGELAGALASGLSTLLADPLNFSASPAGQIGALVGAIVPWGVWLLVQQSFGKNERIGEQHGSAKWAKRAELEAFATANNPNPYNKLILSQHYGLAISRKGFDQIHDRNLNVCVIGGSGSGKTRYFVKPNLMQQSFNYFVTDPKYTLPKETLHLFIDQGWEFAIFNTNITEQSMIYNPFAYLHTDLEISEFVDAFLAMTKDQSKSGGDQFWDDSTNLLLCSLIAYCRDWVPPEEYHFGTLLKLLDAAQVKENDENFKSPLDKLFEEIETGWRLSEDQPTPPAATPAAEMRNVAVGGAPAPKRTPSRLMNNTTGLMPGALKMRGGKPARGLTAQEDYSLGLYKKFKTAAGKTLKSILISVNVKLKAIATQQVLNLLAGPDEMHLEKLTDPECKYIIFDSFKDVNTQTLGFIHGLLVWQTMQMCCKVADSGSGKLKRPMQFILDEFKSLNLPKSIADMISVVRSRNVGMCIILQSMEQLYQMYDEHCANGIAGCCDTILYLGGGDDATNKKISDTVGQETVNQTTTSVSHQGLIGGSWSQNQQTLGRALIDPAEVGKLARDECIVLIKGTQSAKDKKFDPALHPYYRLIDPPSITWHDPVKRWQSPVADVWEPDGTHKRVVRPVFEKVPPAYKEPIDLAAFFADLREKRSAALKGARAGGSRPHPRRREAVEAQRAELERRGSRKRGRGARLAAMGGGK